MMVSQAAQLPVNVFLSHFCLKTFQGLPAFILPIENDRYSQVIGFQMAFMSLWTLWAPQERAIFLFLFYSVPEVWGVFTTNKEASVLLQSPCFQIQDQKVNQMRTVCLCWSIPTPRTVSGTQQALGSCKNVPASDMLHMSYQVYWVEQRALYTVKVSCLEGRKNSGRDILDASSFVGLATRGCLQLSE